MTHWNSWCGVFSSHHRNKGGLREMEKTPESRLETWNTQGPSFCSGTKFFIKPRLYFSNLRNSSTWKRMGQQKKNTIWTLQARQWDTHPSPKTCTSFEEFQSLWLKTACGQRSRAMPVRMAFTLAPVPSQGQESSGSISVLSWSLRKFPGRMNMDICKSPLLMWLLLHSCACAWVSTTGDLLLNRVVISCPHGLW